MKSPWTIEPDFGPEPLGSHVPTGTDLNAASAALRHVTRVLNPDESMLWSYCRLNQRGDLSRAVQASSFVGVPVFIAAVSLAMGGSTVTYAVASLAAVAGVVGSAVVWRRLSRGLSPVVPGFAASLTNRRLIVVSLERPREVWSMNVGGILAAAGESSLHGVGGIWVSGRWIDPQGQVVQTKIPLHIGPDFAPTVAMLRRRLTADCLDAAA